jgi:dipeptidase
LTRFGSISNGLTIEEDYLEANFEKEDRTIQHLFVGSAKSFKGNFSDLLYTTAGKSKQRQACTLGFMEKKNKPALQDFFQALRQHDREDFQPKKATTGCICMHATGFTNPSDTTGSMVAEIRKDQPSTIWLTGTSHPCMSLYVPFYFGNSFDLELLNPGENPDQSLWWQAKTLHQSIEKAYSKMQPRLRSQLDIIQQTWREYDQVLIEKKASIEDFQAFSKSCLEEYYQLLKTWS